MTEEEMAEIMDVSEVSEQSCWVCEFCAGSDIDKDGNQIPGKALCCNIQKYNTVPENVDPASGKNCAYFKAQGADDYENGLRAVVHDRKMSAAYGVDWKLLRDELDVVQKPRAAKLEPCAEARKVRRHEK